MGTAIDLGLVLLVGVATLGLLWSGFRPRRSGETPHCAACDYNLTALESARCPECGTVLVGRAVVLGERSRQPHLIALGAIGLVCVLFLVFQQLALVRWYRHYPTYLVMRHVASARKATATKGWQEIQRRMSARLLSAGQIAQVYTACIEQIYTDDPSGVRTKMVAFLLAAHHTGDLTSAQGNLIIELALLARDDNARPRPAGHRRLSEHLTQLWFNGLLSDDQRRRLVEGWWAQPWVRPAPTPPPLVPSDTAPAPV